MSNIKERDLTCIVCPRGCQMHVSVAEDGAITVTGNTCPRGKAYAEAEMTHPTRTLTTTVATADGSMLSVRTKEPIPKEKLFEAMKVLNSVTVKTAVNFGDVIVADLLGTGADVIATGVWTPAK